MVGEEEEERRGEMEREREEGERREGCDRLDCK